MPSQCPGKLGITRRDFLVAAGGTVAVAGAGFYGPDVFRRWGDTLQQWKQTKTAPPRRDDGMPGPFPGRVREVYHPDAVRPDHAINAPAVQRMVSTGMCQLTGADHVSEAWKRFFTKGDVVGIKVNPVGRRYNVAKAQSISSHELIIEVVNGLKSVGIEPQDIVLFERYADQFRDVYDGLMREPPLADVRWYASSAQYTDAQLDIEGYDRRRDLDNHVVGYDPDVFVQMGYASDAHDPKDDRRFRSHLSVIVTRMVNKIINLPVLKDHGSGGVTLALKNLSHGLNNNVARSHLGKYYRPSGVSGPNQCNTFIPTAVAQQPIRAKTVLHILDGLVGVWQGGPASTSGCVWPRKSLFFATDPVALDHIGWEIIDAKRVEKGLPPVGLTGMATGMEKEAFDRRQPEHIILASSIGLGTFDRARIDYRRTELAG